MRETIPINDTLCPRSCAAYRKKRAVEEGIAREKQDTFEELKNPAGRIERKVYHFMG